MTTRSVRYFSILFKKSSTAFAASSSLVKRPRNFGFPLIVRRAIQHCLSFVQTTLRYFDFFAPLAGRNNGRSLSSGSGWAGNSLSFANSPCNFLAALLYAMAASYCVPNVPSWWRFWLTVIAADHLPSPRVYTPLYFVCDSVLCF